jgi:hypothetical protein
VLLNKIIIDVVKCEGHTTSIVSNFTHLVPHFEDSVSFLEMYL